MKQRQHVSSAMQGQHTRPGVAVGLGLALVLVAGCRAAPKLTWTAYAPEHSLEVTLAVPQGAEVSDLRWAPDGKSLVCSVSYKDLDTAGKLGQRLSIVDPTTGRFTFLTKGYNDRSPVWGPKGMWIAFLRSPRERAAEVRAMQALNRSFRSASARHLRGKKLTPQELRSLQPSPKVQEEASAALMNEQEPGLYVLAPGGRQARELEPPGKTSLGPPSWSPKGRFLAIRATPMGVSGPEGVLVFDTGASAGKPDVVTLPEPSDMTPTALAWSPDGTRIACAGFDVTLKPGETRPPISHDLCCFDVARRQATVLVSRKGLTTGSALLGNIPSGQQVTWAAKGSGVLFLGAASNPALAYRIVDVKTRSVKPYLTATPPDGYRFAGWGAWNPARTVLAVAATPTSGSGGAVLLYYRGQKKASILKTEAPVKGVSWSPDGKQVRIVGDRYVEIAGAP